MLAALGAVLFGWTGVCSVAASEGHWPITRWFLEFAMRRSQSSAAMPRDRLRWHSRARRSRLRFLPWACGPPASPLHPVLAGQSAKFPEWQLRLWRRGARGGSAAAPRMEEAANGLTEQELAPLASSAWRSKGLLVSFTYPRASIPALFRRQFDRFIANAPGAQGMSERNQSFTVESSWKKLVRPS